MRSGAAVVLSVLVSRLITLAVCLLIAVSVDGALAQMPAVQNDAGSGRDAGPTPDEAVRIEPNQQYDASFLPSQSNMGLLGVVQDDDYYSFEATAGSLFTSATTGGSVYWMRLVSPNGQVVANSSTTAFSYAYEALDVVALQFTVAETGTWYLLFDPVIGAGPYSFSFSLHNSLEHQRPPLPDGCSGDYVMVDDLLGPIPKFSDDCYHMRTGLNGLDTTMIDVLIVPPVGPWAERDLRMAQQAVAMWDNGIHELARDMGLDWLDESVQFNVFVGYEGTNTDPLWDPEIVVVLANPVLLGVQGIGIDPIGLETQCRGANPLATTLDWLALPGFDSHHDNQSGTYVEACEGGGRTCYAVNLALDVVPGVLDDVLDINSFDLVAHEVGHCLTIGHVGDAGDHQASAVPYGDIMAYTGQSHFKCVSSLDVEAFALSMSQLVLPDAVLANHNETGLRGAFQVQHKADHVYASPTGLAQDCPQPDHWIVPGMEPPESTATENDAGSGRDAPGYPSMDITIEPGIVYEGSSLGPINDLIDVYHFVGVAGQTFKGWSEGNVGCYTVLAANGTTLENGCAYGHIPINTGPAEVVLPYTGDYYFEIAQLAPALYKFAFDFDQDPPEVRTVPVSLFG